jgi:hypothetical protein
MLGRVFSQSRGEQEYLTRRFDPFDDARPYIKSRYWSWDRGSRSGYLKRYRVPWRISIQPVRPDFQQARRYDWSPSHDQRGMPRPFGTSSADWW